MRVAKLTGCSIAGMDIHEQAIANANILARQEGVVERTTFERLDASQPLPWSPSSFDAVMCIDAINHLPDRRFVLAEWSRVLVPGGRPLFTDPIVITGPLSKSEIAVRSSAGFYLFVPPGEDERLLREAGLDVQAVVDLTGAMAEIARRRQPWGSRQAADSSA